MPRMLERTFLPPTSSLDAIVEIVSQPNAESTTTLSGSDGERHVLPSEVFEVLRDVVTAFAHHEAVTIALVDQRLKAQEAADLLPSPTPGV